MNDTPLHMRLEAMEPEQIAANFPHDLAADLIDAGMSAIDAEHARQAAAVVMEAIGEMQPQGMRRRKAQASSIEATQRTRAATMERKRQEAEPDVHTLKMPQASSDDAGSDAGKLAA